MKAEYSELIRGIFAEEDDALHQKTRSFWNISREWNGLSTDKISKVTVSDAFREIRSIQEQLSEHRVLNYRLESLKDDIIEHGSKEQQRKYTKKNPVPTKVFVL